MDDTRYILIIIGPTGVGKTEFVENLAQNLSIEVINGDMGQMYAPLTIGTAKPDLSTTNIPHHLFNIISKPVVFSALKYRDQVHNVIIEIWHRKRIPVIVGGSSFYLLSLFFPAYEVSDMNDDNAVNDNTWAHLQRIDPKRAAEIDPHDTYRIKRALAIWDATGIRPSEYKPSFDPIAPCVITWLTRDRKQLYQRINKRVNQMMDLGWIDEVRHLAATPWKSFLQQKKIIGYATILSYLADEISYDDMVLKIQQKTRNYAKRQITFWRSFKEKIESALQKEPDKSIFITEYNLTHDHIESYIKHLKNLIMTKAQHGSKKE